MRAWPSYSIGYFLLLNQKKVTKEKGATNVKYWFCNPTCPR
jgi:hypothetical protein